MVADALPWSGIAVFADCTEEGLHNVTLELLGKARELAGGIHQQVLAVLIGHQVTRWADILVKHGADCVYIYDHPELAHFRVEPYANALEDFVRSVQPSCVLIGATRAGRALAPRVAARFRTGLTADCTMLEMREDADLIQIRPAFGGNIMARIATPRHRPQFCTVRYKVFSQSEPDAGQTGRISHAICQWNGTPAGYVIWAPNPNLKKSICPMPRSCWPSGGVFGRRPTWR
jgi:electron transfer flavoprotein alpha subunit